MFNSIFTDLQSITMKEFLICIGMSLLCGAIIAVVQGFDKKHTGTMLISLIVLPPIVQTVIMMVNGNLGVGVAVMGAFSLVRFRSLPGNAKDITMIFLAMSAGLACGVGYVYFALAVTVVLCAVIILAELLLKITAKTGNRKLSITIPENLDYSDIFDDIFKKYTFNSELIKVKTVNMGTMYELQYFVKLKDIKEEKAMIDEIRCRNGNLTVVCGKTADGENTI